LRQQKSRRPARVTTRREILGGVEVGIAHYPVKAARDGPQGQGAMTERNIFLGALEKKDLLRSHQEADTFLYVEGSKPAFTFHHFVGEIPTIAGKEKFPAGPATVRFGPGQTIYAVGDEFHQYYTQIPAAK
jgi:hypothetical protein